MPKNIDVLPTDTWFSLQDAANRLNVHAATLRRWADSGDLPHMLTPGGHRRFALSDLEKFAGDRRVNQRKESLPEAWAAKAMTHTRQELPAANNANWLAPLNDAVRAQHRALGQRLMGLTLQYISADDGDDLLREAHAIGLNYGVLSQKSGVPMTDALQAALYFRDKLLEATLDLSETAHVRPSDNARLVKRINALLNAVQLAIAEVYDAESHVAKPPRRKSQPAPKSAPQPAPQSAPKSASKVAQSRRKRRGSRA